jgi:hypothetical protein
MKKILTTVAVVLCTAGYSQAQVNLQSFGSAFYTVDGGSTAVYSQDGTGITLSGSPTLGDALYPSSMIKSVADWSSFPDFGIRMTLTGVNPNFSFTVEFSDASFASINQYQGTTAGLGASPTVVPLTLSSPGTGNLAGVEYVQFFWGGGGSAVNTTMTEIVGVPEPSTYAMLAMSGLAFGGYIIRRRSRA